MILKKLKIQNFRSFGNNINEIIFDENKGSLNLLVGENGEGKSSIPMALDYVLYGEVKNFNKKLKLSSLPNRFNNNLMVELDFVAKNNDINIIRRNPNDLSLCINNIVKNNPNKDSLQNELENNLDFDLDSWKSFISMSINDFKNFIHLKPEEKRILLDKLFNLEIINEISKILKEQKKQYKHQIQDYDSTILGFDKSLIEFKNSIKKIKSLSEDNRETEKEEYKELLLSKKEEYKNINNKLLKCKEKEVFLQNEISKLQQNGIKINYEINEHKEKISLIDSGICPTCNSDLMNDKHDLIRNELKIKIEALGLMKSELKTQYTDILNKQKKLALIHKETDKLFSDLTFILKNAKNKIKEIESDNTSVDVEMLNYLTESVLKIENDKKEFLDKKDNISINENHYENMIKIISNDGVKKEIISKIVEPINKFIKYNLDKLNINLDIKLDNEFNAIIRVMGEEIDFETLSTGELKKINIAIMLAYLKLIRTKKHVNVLFLDEVFSSISIKMIYPILELLKDFANELNINIFLVHHAILDKEYFDNIIKIEKDITSNIYYK